jgi:hypothetical protein
MLKGKALERKLGKGASSLLADPAPPPLSLPSEARNEARPDRQSVMQAPRGPHAAGVPATSLLIPEAPRGGERPSVLQAPRGAHGGDPDPHDC